MSRLKTLLKVIFLFSVIFFSQSFTIQESKKKDDDKPTNLKVLPKNMSEEEIHALMKVYAKSLGVKCNHCHAQKKDDPTKLEFASDEKPEKAIARKMMKMTADINKKYISKIGDLKTVACVTCHMGQVKPVNSVDSLVVGDRK